MPKSWNKGSNEKEGTYENVADNRGFANAVIVSAPAPPQPHNRNNAISNRPFGQSMPNLASSRQFQNNAPPSSGRSFNRANEPPAQRSSFASNHRFNSTSNLRSQMADSICPQNNSSGNVRANFNNFCSLKPIDWSVTSRPKLVKNLYVEANSVRSRSEEEMTKWVEMNEILLYGASIPRPCFTFDEPGFPVKVVEHLKKAYEKPTLTQCISWPVALTGQDMVSVARTGSGKTLAFLLPGIVHTVRQPERRPLDGPTVLILLPTRELAQQAGEVARVYGGLMGLSVATVYGGMPKHEQQLQLQTGVDICVATPGRLLAFLRTSTLSLRRCSYLVLDEADRMLEMGFEDQMITIISQIRPDRQTLMFTATWPVEVRQFAKKYQTSPVFLNVGSLDLSANRNIEQHVEIVNESEKPQLLNKLLDTVLTDDGKVIIFFGTKRKADEVETKLQHKWRVISFHGSKAQILRDQVMSEFKYGSTRILLATDLAARGLDIFDVKAVINYDFPPTIEQYIHRIGRTARREEKGKAFTFMTRRESSKANELIKVLTESKQNIPQQLMELANQNMGDVMQFAGSSEKN